MFFFVVVAVVVVIVVLYCSSVFVQYTWRKIFHHLANRYPCVKIVIIGHCNITRDFGTYKL